MPSLRTATVVLAALLCAACQDHEPTQVGDATRTPATSLTATTPAPPGTVSARPSRRPRPSFHPQRAEYVFPVRGCNASASPSHHDYPASDIFTDRGCRFVAVTSGLVDEVSFVDRWDAGTDDGATRGGLSVSIVGDDGVRYYGSHLERIGAGIRPGVRVRPGRVLGRIDNSGDARYTPTHVHFGISWPTRAGAWWVRRGEVWPQRYLAAWRAGRDLSPAAEVGRAHRRMGSVPPCRVEC